MFSHLKSTSPEYRLGAFVSATGSAGTIAAGDYLKALHGSKTVAVEALECPTMLCNGYGEHNIQGIGDKHIPLIHNVMSTDLVAGVSDTDDRRAQPAVQQQRRPRLSQIAARRSTATSSAGSTTSASRGSRTSSPPSRSPSTSTTGPTMW